MTATIYYLRPFEREDLSEADRPAEPEAEERQAESGKRRGKRSMPGSRDSKWKRKIGGGIVPRDKRS